MTASSIPPDIPLLGANNPCSFFAVLEVAKTQGTKQGTIAALLSLERFMKIHSNTKTIQYDNTKYCTCIPVSRGIERQHPGSRTDRTIPGKHLARYLLPFRTDRTIPGKHLARYLLPFVPAFGTGNAQELTREPLHSLSGKAPLNDCHPHWQQRCRPEQGKRKERLNAL